MKKSVCILLAFFFCICCKNENSSGPSSSTEKEWIRDSTKHFQLFAEKGVRSQNKLKATGDKMEEIQDELLSLLGENKKRKLDVYFLKDRETLTSFTGFPANGYTDTEKGVIYFVDKDPFHLALRHEIMHALSWKRWGRPSTIWLSEGIAVYASGGCGKYNLHSLAQAITTEGKLLSFKTLEDSFDFRAIEPSLQAGSMVQYIYETYGLEVLKGFWKEGSDSKTLGISVVELERRWKEFIKQERFAEKVDWSLLKESGCE